MINFTRFIALIFIISSCTTKEQEIQETIYPLPEKELDLKSDLAIKWAETTIKFIKTQNDRSPTYISRSLGYMGLTMYESVVQGSKYYQSVSPFINNSPNLVISNANIDWETSLNAGQAYMLKKMYQHGQSYSYMLIDSLENAVNKERYAVLKDSTVFKKSIDFGKNIAIQIYEWSKNDGGHLGYLENFDRKYVYPFGAGFWSPPFVGQSSEPFPMHPKWGSNRPFIINNSSLPIPKKMDYSIDKNSDYYKDFKEINEITANLTQSQKEIALWWGDDPSETAAPAGHSYNLAILLIKQQKPNLFKSCEALAKVGMSVADAFICCWKVKYTYHSERPANYIRRNINPSFNQFWPEPPFPAFSSGHSTQAASAATALISVFGNNVSFEDITHQGRPTDMFRNVAYKKRAFSTIWQTAEECGISRLYGGIHTMQDNIVGLEMGKNIGNNVANLPWRKVKRITLSK